MLLVAIVFVTMARVDMLNIFSIRANAEEDTSGICGDNLIWRFEEETGTLTISGTGKMYDYSFDDIPLWEEYGVKKADIVNVIVSDGVTSIGDFAFNSCSELISVDLPQSLERIGNMAFLQCKKIATIHLPDNVHIFDDAFYSCTSLKSVTIPSSAESFAGSFTDCFALTNITINNGVTKISEGAFSGCSCLENITIPTSVINIENNSFSGCTSLTEITIPENVTSVGTSVFKNCSKLVTINYNAVSCSGAGFKENPTPLHAFDPCNWLYGCINIERVNIGDKVKTIPTFAFYYCNKVNTIIIPDSVINVQEHSFDNCHLKYVKIGNGLPTIPATLINKESLEALIIGNGVSSIDENAFKDCTLLNNIVIPGSVTSIGRNAFYNTGYYNTPTNWENDVFLYIGDCFIKSKETATFCNVKEGTRVIADYGFYHCTRLDTISLPDSLRSVGKYAFYDCKVVKSITLPEGVTEIRECTFSNCDSLEDVVLPNSVTQIGKRAFAPYNSLTPIIQRIVIPENCSYIGDEAFSACSNLVEITYPKCNFSLGNRVFAYCNSLRQYNIPSNCISISSAPFAGSTGAAFFSVDEDNPNYKNDSFGAIYTKDGKVLIEYPAGTDTVYAISEGTEEIGEYAFGNNSCIETISFSESITRVKQEAFGSNYKLATVYYPGTQVEWNEIIIEKNNTYLVNATKYFEHTHLGEITTELSNVREATCTENGYSGDLCCSVCGAIVESGSVQPAKGHSAGEWTVTKPASCSEFGEKVKICDVCGDIIAEEQISKLPHTYDEYFIPATCKEEGQEICLCSECGYGYAKPTPKLNHSFTNYIYNNDATTEKDGTETAKCDRCDATDTRTKPGTKLSGGSDAPTEPAAPGGSEGPEEPTVPGGSEAPAELVVPDKPDVSKVKISAPTGTKKINWRCKAHLTATAANLPGSCHIEWYENGKSVCDKADFVTASLTEAHTYTAKIIDEKGNVVSTPAQEKTVTIEVKDDFFTKIISFFSRLFGSDVVKV